MALPVEIVTRTVTYGPETDFQGNSITGSLTFTPSEDITWVAAGQGLHVKPITVNLNSSGSGSIDLICTDQTGFRNANGQNITNWFYTVTADLVGVPGSTRKFVVPSGVGSLDLDTMIPITTGTTTISVPVIVNSVAGRTGAVTLTKNDVGLGSLDANETALRIAADAAKVDEGAVTFNVVDYGASPSASAATNYASITAALTALKAATGSSRILLLPDAGVYQVSAPIVLDQAGIALRGGGKGVTTLKMTVAQSFQPVVRIAGTDVSVASVTLDANGFATYGVSAVADMDRALVTDVGVTGSTGPGVWFQDCDDVTMVRVSTVGCGTSGNAAGFFTSGCNNLTLDHCSATSSFQHGYYLLGAGTAATLGLAATGLTLTGCRATGNGGTGFSVRMARTSMSGCVSWGNGLSSLTINPAVELPSALYGELTTVTGCVLGGTTTDASTAEVLIVGDRVTFTGNTVKSSATSYGLRLIGGDDLIVTGNTVTVSYASLAGAVRIDGGAVNGVVSDNILVGTGVGRGVQFDTCTDMVVQGNQIVNFTNGVATTATACSNIAILFNVMKTVTIAVANASTGTNVTNIGNDIPTSLSVAIPLVLTAPFVMKPVAQTLASNGAVVINAATGNAEITLQANATSSTISNVTAANWGQQLAITFVQDATGGRTYVYPTECKFAGGSAPSDTTANRRTTVTFRYNGSAGKWFEQSRAVAVG